MVRPQTKPGIPTKSSVRHPHVTSPHQKCVPAAKRSVPMSTRGMMTPVMKFLTVLKAYFALSLLVVTSTSSEEAIRSVIRKILPGTMAGA